MGEPLVRKESDNHAPVVTTAQISEILDVSTRRIQQLAKEGVLVRISHGSFDLKASIKSYIEFRISREQEDDELDKTTEEALWTRARRQKTELELQIMRGDLHRSEDVKRVMNDMIGAFRARILSIPSKFAPQLVGKTEIPPIKAILKNAVFETLEELAEYDPVAFYDMSKDKLLLDDDEETESKIDDIESDGESVPRGRQTKK